VLSCQTTTTKLSPPQRRLCFIGVCLLVFLLPISYKNSHITPVLRDVLHWLPVRQPKVAATAFYCIRGTGPTYFKHVYTPVSDISGRAHLRSAERRDTLVSRIRTELGRLSFPVAAPTVWNSLPAHLRSTLISRRQFRDGLKSHLFADAYFWSSENMSVTYLLTYLLTYLQKLLIGPSWRQKLSNVQITVGKQVRGE